MDPVTFEQMSVEAGLLGAQRPFLTEGMALKLQFHEGIPLSGAPPARCLATRVKTCALLCVGIV